MTTVAFDEVQTKPKPRGPDHSHKGGIKKESQMALVKELILILALVLESPTSAPIITTKKAEESSNPTPIKKAHQPFSL